MNQRKQFSSKKYVATAVFILVFLAAQFTPPAADDGTPPTPQPVTYIKGETPVFDHNGAVKGDVPAEETTATPTGNNANVDEPKSGSVEIPPTANIGEWDVLYYQGWEVSGLPGALGWSTTSLNGSDICWDDADTGVAGALAFNGVWSVWPSDGCTNGNTPNNLSGTYKNNIETSLTYGPFSLAGATDAKLDFMLNSVTETNYDYFCYSASADGINFSGDCMTGTTNGWAPVTLSLSAYKGDSSVWVEFYFYSDFIGGGQGPFVDDIFITTKHTLSYDSNAAQDGWVLESSETSNKGGTIDAAATTLRLGDNAADKQYKSIVSFDTTSIPDTATITEAVLKVRIKNTTGNVSTFGGIGCDIKKPRFGAISLEPKDFQVLATVSGDCYASVAVGTGWYLIPIAGPNPYINKTGTTQLRLRYYTDDNDDLGADYLNIYSGNAGAANAPKLIVEYTLP